MDKTAVLIPCYNESQTIARVVKEYKEALPEAVIYVYDNNSDDHTDELARQAGAVVRYEYRQGKGNVIRSMFRDIDAQCYLMIDGDDTYPAENAKSMTAGILSGRADMVIGDRLSSTYFTENKRPFHNVGNRLVRGLINLIFGSSIRDIMTGCRAFNYEFVKSFPILSKGFEIETEMSIHALDKNFRLQEIPILYRDRPEGSVSKLNTYKDGFRVIKTIARLFREYRPAAFFGWLGLLCFLTATVFFLPILKGFMDTGLVLKVPTLIACSGLYVISFLLWMCGVLLEVIVRKNRQMFELYLTLFRVNQGSQGGCGRQAENCFGGQAESCTGRQAESCIGGQAESSNRERQKG